MEYVLKNEKLEARFDTKGAELISVKAGGKEYIWQADPDVWARHAPVLFPFVGQVRDGVFRYAGVEYKSGQHGFARDMEFELVEQSEDEISFVLKGDESTLSRYPFLFELYIKYLLTGNRIDVEWQVKNVDDKDMHFSIGGHPGFACPLDGRGDWEDNRILFKKDDLALDEIVIRPITTGGNVGAGTESLSLDNGCLTPTDQLFSNDALILEDRQVDRISLIDPDGEEYLAVSFDAPLAGVWTPVGKHAPFICIEPWFGRTDRDDFTGSLEEREYSNCLQPGGEFVAGYSIEVWR